MHLVVRKQPCKILTENDKAKMRDAIESTERDGRERWFAKCRDGRITATCRGGRTACKITTEVCPEYAYFFHTHPSKAPQGYKVAFQVFSGDDIRVARKIDGGANCLGYFDPEKGAPVVKCIDPKKITIDDFLDYIETEWAAEGAVRRHFKTSSEAIQEVINKGREVERRLDVCELSLLSPEEERQASQATLDMFLNE